MKVLQINCVYRTGSTGKIVYDIHTELEKQGIDSVVCYGRGAKSRESKVYKTSNEKIARFNNIKSRISGKPYVGSLCSTNKLISIIKKEKPDIVHLHCINGFFVNIYRLVTFLKKKSIPTVVTHHAEFMYTGNCGHSYECEKWKKGCGNCPSVRKAVNSYVFDCTSYNFKRMRDAFDGFRNLVSVSVSPWLENRSVLSPIFKDVPHTTIFNGLDTNTFKLKNNTEEMRNKLKIPEDKKVIIHVTASFSSEVKGGRFVKELARKMPEVIFLVVGNRDNPKDLPDNIITLGRIENQNELAGLYEMADLSIITGKKETFSMPVAESLCVGTPVVGFCAGGPETIAISEYSRFVEYGNVQKLKNITDEMLSVKFEKDAISEEAKSIYSKEKMCNEYIRIYNNLHN